MPKKIKVTESELTELADARASELNDGTLDMLTERLADLELALEDEGWVKLDFMSDLEFSRDGLAKICKLARVMWLKNPIIKRGVNVQTFYVFGQGMSISAKAPEVNEVVQAFLDDAKNEAELTTHEARMEKERDLQIESNIFFCFFTKADTGRVRVRTIPFDEIVDVIKNPEDSKEPWYYKRSWTQKTLDPSTGFSKVEPKVAYYPDWRYQPPAKERLKTIGTDPIMWDNPVYHVRTGGLSNMTFGVSEVYAAIDWARAYKDFLENWSTIVKAYARFAWNASGMGSQTAMDALKTKLGSTLPTTGVETNPPPVVASTLLTPGNQKMEPIRTAGATTAAEDGRRLLLMAAMVFGLPETFFSDASVGTLATAKSLDRPTELQMLTRQTLWANIHRNILNFVVLQAVKAGTLPGTIIDEDDGTPRIDLGDIDPTITISYPPILEHDIAVIVDAIKQAATLDGQPLAGTIDMPTVARMMLSALGEEDIDAMLEQQFPEGETVAETKMVAAAKELSEAVREVRESINSVS